MDRQCRRNRRKRERAMSKITPKKYLSKPTMVEAIQISRNNMADVAEWCGGEVKVEKDGAGKVIRFVKVKVWRAQNPKQTQGFVGCWVLRRPTGFKVYTDKAFKSSFTDGDSIPMVEDDPTVSPALFNGMIAEMNAPRTTTVRLNDRNPNAPRPSNPSSREPREFKVITPATGVPMRGVEHGFPQGSIAVFHEPDSTGFEPPAE
jgi:hypothetical protein